MEASFAGAMSSTISTMLSFRISQQLAQMGVPEDQLQLMREKFVCVQQFVDIVPNNDWGNNSHQVIKFLRKVNCLTFFIENTIDGYNIEILHRKNRSNNKKTSCFSLGFRTSRKITKIFSWLNELQNEVNDMGAIRAAAHVASPPSSNGNESVTPEGDPGNIGLVGRDNEVDTVVSTLCNRNTKGEIFSFAIFGIGGLGKTALAKTVYQNVDIQNCFGKRFWIEVGEVFDATRTLKEMLQSLHEEMLNLSDYEVIRSKLLDLIRREKILIVLDDVCSVSREQLTPLYSLQSHENQISILVTTQRSEVARAIDAFNPLHLTKLSEEDSRSLFKLVASRVKTIEEDSELGTIESMIVEKCCGVPRLILKLVGSLQDKELILSTLSSNFSLLPKALRRCFAYCSIFPKGATIQKSDLIRLWIAQGFLSEENISVESETEMAEKFIDILLSKSLLQVVENDEDGDDMYYTMHDLAYDLAVKFSRHDVLMLMSDDEVTQRSCLSDVQHLVVSTENIKEALNVKTSSSIERLRTIYIKKALNAVPENLLSQSRFLYVLKLDGIGLKEVPKNLGKLKLLRYLDLSNNPIKYLPDSITRLYLLQTLLLINCTDLSKIPEGLFDSTNLRLEAPPQLLNQMVPATALRIQPPVKLDEEGGSVKISELGDLIDIAGPLCISGLEYVKDKEAAQKARIGKKHGLAALELSWNRKILEASECQDEDVLDGLQPHPKIRRLRLMKYEGRQFPIWVTRMKGQVNERLDRLVKIELFDCIRCQQLPTMGQLPRLRELIIAGMDNIETLGPELYNHLDDTEQKDVLKVLFPALTRLELRNFSKLKEWQPAPGSETNDDSMCQAFPRLETLQVVNCPNLTSIPTTFPRLKHLLIEGIKSPGNWLDTILSNTCRDGSTLTSIVLCMVSDLRQLTSDLFQCESLEELSLLKCQKFNYWPRSPWNLVSLKVLCIDDCPLLTSPPHLEGLTSLNTVVIRGCPILPGAPRSLRMCTSLTKLSISNCSNLLEVPDLQQLTSLEELDILDCGKIKTLPPGLHCLPNLRTIRVGSVRNKFDSLPEFQSLEKVWLKGMNCLPEKLKDLPQLKVLRIISFACLATVPDWICDLKNLEILIFEECDIFEKFPSREKMTQLKKLRCLRIEKCPIFEELFDNGSEWRKIYHVPHIKIKGIWHHGDRRSLLQERSAASDHEHFANYGVDSYYDHDANGDVGETNNHENDDNSGGSMLFYLYFLVFYLLSIVITSLYWACGR